MGTEIYSNPLVSVIIPVYNVLPFLHESLDSVLNQSYQNLQIIIVDDGSTDGSSQICDEYMMDSRVIVIHKKNSGLSAARNVGLDNMSGDYVAFLDSDDIFFPEMIQTMVEGLVRTECDMAVCYFEKFGDGIEKHEGISSATGDELIINSSEALEMLLSGDINFAVWNKIYKSNLWKDIRFQEGFVHEDVEVMYRLIERSIYILKICKPLVRYRIRSDSISNVNSIKHIKDWLRAFKVLEKHIADCCSETAAKERLAIFRDFYVWEMIWRYKKIYLSEGKSEATVILRREILRVLKKPEFQV